MFKAWSLAPGTAATLQRLAALEPTTLLAMHGSAFEGNGRGVLEALAQGLVTVAAERARA